MSIISPPNTTDNTTNSFAEVVLKTFQILKHSGKMPSLNNFLPRSLLCFAKNFLAQLAIISLVLEQFIFVSTASASALPITPDGTTNTQVTQTASGIDQINIATPNPSGLSHNKFTDYNVNSPGQIINDFSGSGATAGSGANAVISTQIGGLVTVNPNLVSSGSAAVILIEVTSGNVSKLLGYTEIAGSKADLILANPNGITCSGCGFINTARLLMIAGKSDFDANGNLGFDLKEQANPNLYVPLITIDGLGLDASNTSGTEIVASSVKLLSSIFGSDSNSIAIRTGDGRYDYTTKSITGNSAKNNTDPVFAIDASSLAKIQAGLIYLIATKDGVGVKMESEILASQTLNLDASGDIYYKKITVGNSANLKSSGKIQATDSASISAPAINIEAMEFANVGSVLANSLNIRNAETINNSGSLKALDLNLSNITNINNSGIIFGQDSLEISATNLTNASLGTIESVANYTITLASLLDNSGLITSGNNLTINSGQISNSSEISAQNNLILSVVNSANSSGNLIAGNALSLGANSFVNSGETRSGSNSTFILSSLTNNSNSLIYSGGTLDLNLSSALNNDGSISSQDDLTISGSAAINNSYRILSNSALSLSALSLSNNSAGAIASLFDSTTLTITNNLINGGQISSDDDLAINAKNLTNTGNILSNKRLTITAENSVSNSRNLQSISDFTLTSASLTNSSAIKSFGKTSITSAEINNEDGGLIYSADDLAIISSTSFTNSSDVLSDAKINLTSGISSNSGDILASNDFVLSLTGALTNSGNLSSLGNLTISSNSDINNTNKISSNGGLDITAADLTNSGLIQSNDDLSLDLANLINTNTISSIKTVDIVTSGNLSNLGSLKADDTLNISANNLTNSTSSLILAENNLAINASSINNQNTKPSTSIITSGIVSANGAVALRTDNLNNNSGIISAKSTSLNALNASSVNLSNTLGAYLSQHQQLP